MKKLTVILLCLILVLSWCCVCFADGLYEIDAQSGKIVGASEETLESVDFVRFSVNWGYDKASRMYVYTSDEVSGTEFECSVYNGMYTTGAVDLSASDTTTLKVYRNGEEVEFSGSCTFVETGAYIVRDKNNNQVFSFTILNILTNSVNSYSVPSVFFIDTVFVNNEQQTVDGNTVSMLEDGKYEITYFNYDAGVKYTLTLNIDHTAPELEIIGLNEEGYARNAVSFGKTEWYSTVTITKDGVNYEYSEDVPLTEAGDYYVEYTDEAGNLSIYEFTIRQYLDLNGWVAAGIAVLIVVGVISLVIYYRTHMRVR